MNRRSFLGTLVGGVATTAAVRTWPFRVYSFPSAPVLTDFATEPLMVKHVMAWNAAHELWYLRPGQKLYDTVGNLIIANDQSQAILAKVPLARYLRAGVLDKLIEQEYGWNEMAGAADVLAKMGEGDDA